MSNKKGTKTFGSCSKNARPIVFKLAINIVLNMTKITVTKANSLDVLPHLKCVLLRSLHFCYVSLELDGSFSKSLVGTT